MGEREIGRAEEKEETKREGGEFEVNDETQRVAEVPRQKGFFQLQFKRPCFTEGSYPPLIDTFPPAAHYPIVSVPATVIRAGNQ